MSVLLDLQGVQSRFHGERGIARYLVQLADALERSFPDAVAGYLLNHDFPAPGALDCLPSPDRIGSIDELPAGPTVYHVGSPFEPDVAIDRLWPKPARGMRLVVTLYDLIPELFAERYLADPLVRGWYRTRLGLLRHADRVLAISQSTANDGIRELGLRPERVVVVGAAPAPMFKPPVSREAAFAELRRRVSAIEPGFVLYTGGIEFRKNIDRLLVAYAGLSEPLRRVHQLVIVCKIEQTERSRLATVLRRLGIADRVHFTGYVSDEDLVLLYGAAHLFVFPSLYEGYGLPVAEAMACGAPVVSSETSSLGELVKDEAARFDPHDADAIRATVERGLLDTPFRERLGRSGARGLQSWEDVARQTASTYDELVRRPKIRRPRKRPRIAYLSPLPPHRSGIADYSYRLLESLSGYFEIDAFADMSLGDAQAPPGVRVGEIGNFEVIERTRSGYDHVLICLGNSEHHASALKVLRRRGGIVLAHDVRLSGLYAFCADRRPEIEPRSFSKILVEMYGDKLPDGLAGMTWLDPIEADAHGIFMAREAIAAAERFVVHSDYAANFARAEAEPEDRCKIQVAPFAFPDPAEFAGLERAGDAPLIGTFGVVAPIKQTAKVLDAFAVVSQSRPDCRLAIVGPPAGPGDLEQLLEQAASLGLTDRVLVTGHLNDKAFRSFITRSTIAVQLRAVSMGESPASVTDCLAAGIPTIATEIGAVREFPDDALLKVSPDVHPEELGRLMLSLLAQPEKRASLSEAGRALARDRSFKRSAQFLYEMLTEDGQAQSRAVA